MMKIYNTELYDFRKSPRFLDLVVTLILATRVRGLPVWGATVFPSLFQAPLNKNNCLRSLVPMTTKTTTIISPPAHRHPSLKAGMLPLHF